MRIGALAQKYQLPIDTIRYYINSGLLVPNSKNKQYDFNEKDLDDLTLIIKLKNLYFSINDIHHILSLKRISNFEDLRDLKAFEQILTEHKNNLVQIHNNTQQIIDNLSKEISNLSENYKSKGETPFICSGVPLLFLPYLYCPSCHKPLSLKNATIENQQIFQGLLDCACGYQAKIENGILSTDKGHLAKGDVPDIERKYYKSMSSCCMTLFKKSYNWIFNQLIQENLQQKIIMENSINSFFFLLTHLECLNKDALYIVADNHPDIVVMYKKIIDNMNLHLNILYLSAGTLQY
ncbi:MAG: MerR family transcriptional regulator, partial [Clostridiales bacterium]